MDDKFIHSILNGASLSTVMVPDPKHPSNQPRHDETYKINFIYFNEDANAFFAQTNSMHRPVRNNIEHSKFHSFCYSYNQNNLMMIHCPEKNFTKISKIEDRYSEFKWVSRADYKVVWTNKTQTDMTELRKAIAEGRDLKLAIRDDTNLWHIMPVDLANITTEQDEFIIRTETGVPPAIIIDEKVLQDFNQRIQLIKRDRDQFINLDIPGINIFYCCYSNGTYYNYFDEQRIIRRKYKELRIFCRDDKTNPLTIEAESK